MVTRTEDQRLFALSGRLLDKIRRVMHMWLDLLSVDT